MCYWRLGPQVSGSVLQLQYSWWAVEFGGAKGVSNTGQATGQMGNAHVCADVFRKRPSLGPYWVHIDVCALFDDGFGSQNGLLFFIQFFYKKPQVSPETPVWLHCPSCLVCHALPPVRWVFVLDCACVRRTAESREPAKQK